MNKSSYQGIFLDGNGNLVEGERGIAPIFTTINGSVRFLGTAFFITRNGLMLTARHNLFNKSGKALNSLFIIQFIENNEAMIRPIYKSYHNYSDVAALIPQNISSKKTKQPLLNLACRLTFKKQKKGDPVISCAYPKTIV